MSLGTPIHRGSNGGTGSTHAVTLSGAPAAGSLLLATVGRRYNSALPAAPAITSNNALTWNTVALSPATIDTGSGIRLRIFAAWAIATGAETTVTAAYASGPKSAIHVTEIPRAFAGISNFAADDDAAGDPTAVMAAPGGASLSFAFAAFTDVNPVSPPATGFTELHERVTSTDLITQTSYHMTATDTAAWTTSNNTNALGAIMEIRPAGRMRAVGLWFS